MLLREFAKKAIFKCCHLSCIPDVIALRTMYRVSIGKKLRLTQPKGFNEKLQWLKLHDRNPDYQWMIDKISVKQWVAQKIGLQHVIPTLKIWDSADDIILEDLPERFVIKTNHDSGTVIVCADRASFSLDNAIRKLNKSLKRNYYYCCREWPYKNIERKVFMEVFIDDGQNGELIDYKILCFNGIPRIVFTCVGRHHGDLRVDFFDLNWNHLPFERHYRNADVIPDRPVSFEQMLEFAEILSEGLPFVRVDFFESQGVPLFGEMTFYPGSGFEEFDPSEWDEIIGSWIDLSLVGK